MVNYICRNVSPTAKPKDHKLQLILILVTIVITLFIFEKTRGDTLESWQSCCGAVCLRTASGLLGNQTDLAEIRELLQPNNKGETSLAEIAETAKRMGFYSMGFKIKSEKLNTINCPQATETLCCSFGIGQRKRYFNYRSTKRSKEDY